MSAIAGLFQRDGQPVCRTDVEYMSACLIAHGPDRAGCWQQDAIGLAQRQLVITSEDQFERQPLRSHDGQLTLVSDVRLDNRRELTTQLRISHTESQTLPDSALILRAYEHWGEDAPKHLLGDYAFALWDGRQQMLFLARSPLGNRALYYYHTPRSFAFATMPNGLFALPWVPRKLALERLLDVEPNYTLFQGIHKLEGGHWLRVSKDGLQEERFWQLDLERRVYFKRDEEYMEAFQELLTNAVESRLRSLYPIGISMSGGLDSSTVAATAAPLLAQQGKSLSAFTEVPRPGFAGTLPAGRYADETPFVQAVAAMYPNLRLHFINATDQPLFADVDRFFDAMVGPFQNVSNRPWIEAIQAQAHAQGVRVLLTGEAGNFTVSWKGTSPLPALVRQGAWQQAWCSAQTETGTCLNAGRRLARQGILPLLPSRVQAFMYYLRRGSLNALSAAQPLPVSFQRRWIQARHRQRWTQRHFPVANTERIARQAGLLLLANSDYEAAYAAQFGISRRDPTRDQRLVEFCFAVPETEWRRGQETRSLIRRAMAGRLPSSVLYNPRRGLQAAGWYEQLLAQRTALQADLTALMEHDAVHQYLDLSHMQQLIDNLPQMNRNDSGCAADYQWGILWGLMLGHFIRWFEADRRPMNGMAHR